MSLLVLVIRDMHPLRLGYRIYGTTGHRKVGIYRFHGSSGGMQPLRVYFSFRVRACSNLDILVPVEPLYLPIFQSGERIRMLRLKHENTNLHLTNYLRVYPAGLLIFFPPLFFPPGGVARSPAASLNKRNARKCVSCVLGIII